MFGIDRREFRTFLSLCIALAGVLAAAPEARADASISVDASAMLQVSQGDDLATLQNIFQDANMPADGSTPVQPVTQLMTDLAMKRTRLLQSDVFCDLDGNGNFGTNSNGIVTGPDCVPLLWQIQWALYNHLSPHVAVASYMPASFTARNGVAITSAENWSPTVLASYKSYAQKLVTYILNQSFCPVGTSPCTGDGAPSVVFEVSNEMDAADPSPVNWQAVSPPQNPAFTLLPLGPWGRWLWWINPVYNIAQWPPAQANVFPYDNDAYPYNDGTLAYPYAEDMRRLDHGISPVQKIFADAVSTARSGYPGKTVEIAGPAFSSYDFAVYPAKGEATLEEVFLDLALNPHSAIDPTTNLPRFNTSLDHFSFHFYGDFLNGANPQAPQYTTLKYMTTTIQNKLNALNSKLTLFVSEWGPSVDDSNPPPANNPNPNPDINYSHKGAAWAAAFLNEAVADQIAMGSYLIVHDAVGLNSGNVRQASLMHKYISGGGSVSYYPKPVANVFKMFAMMTGTRRPITLVPTTGSNVGAFAASDATSAGVVVFNYDKLMFSRPAMDTPENVSVVLNNLPFDGANGYVTVQRYLVDATHSNLSVYVDQSSGQVDVDPALSPDPQQIGLQMVDQLCLPVVQTGNIGQLTLPSLSLGLGVTFWQVLSQVPCARPDRADNPARTPK